MGKQVTEVKKGDAKTLSDLAKETPISMGDSQQVEDEAEVEEVGVVEKLEDGSALYRLTSPYWDGAEVHDADSVLVFPIDGQPSSAILVEKA